MALAASSVASDRAERVELPSDLARDGVGRARLGDQRQVAQRRRQDHRLGDREGGLRLDVGPQRVLLDPDLVAGLQLALGEHVVVLEGGDRLVGQHLGQRVGRGAQVLQPPLLGFRVPVLVVVVAAEADLFVVAVGLLDDLDHGLGDVDAAGGLRLQLVRQLVDASATIVLRTVFGKASDMLDPSARNSNLLPVKAKGEVRLRSPPCIGSERQHRRAQLEEGGRRVGIALPGRDRLEDFLQLGAEEDRDDRRRRLVGAQAVVLADVGDRGAQQALVLVDRLDHRGAEEEEVDVVGRRVARVEQVGAGVGAHRPVVVLAGAVDAGEGLLVQQADQAVAAGDAFHHLHHQLLVVGADVRVLEDRRDLVLVRRHLVVAGLDRDAELAHLQLGLQHAGEDPLGDRAEVVVVELVALGRLGAEQGAAGADQVGALEVVLLVDQEVLLLGARRW